MAFVRIFYQSNKKETKTLSILLSSEKTHHVPLPLQLYPRFLLHPKSDGIF